jgi:Icc-related predicted phosphoesterase
MPNGISLGIRHFAIEISVRILALSDEVVDWIYSPSLRARAATVDLVVSCGDLPIWYLEFISSSLDAPCAFVRGNHDTHQIGEGGVIKDEPAGWINLDKTVLRLAGLRVAGLQGCVRYKPDAPYQYSQRRQWARALALFPRLALRRLWRGRGVDVFVAHAPPYGIHNGYDRAHTGFKVYRAIMSLFNPQLLLHGHQHRTYAPSQDTHTRVDGTEVINVHPYRFIEIKGLEVQLNY